MNSDDATVTPFVWESLDSSIGFTAQEITTIDLSDINLSAANTITITSSQSTSSFNWNSTGSSVSIVDPYEEMEKRLKAVEDIIAEEKAIRDSCPSVKQAYDEYKLLLELARGPLTDL
jgi:hypothetical protein